MAGSAAALPPVAPWASGSPDPAVVLPPGALAVSCGLVGHGATRGEALAACERAVRADRWVSARRCGCRAHADVVVLAPTARPAFWMAGWNHTGPTAQAALARCLADREGAEDLDAGVALEPGACVASLQAVWGPFTRRVARAEFDDETRYRWLTPREGWVDAFGEGPCFTGDTAVATPSGERPIAALRVGDAVLGWSLDGVADEGPARVTRVKRRVVAEVLALRFEDGRVLRATENHPLYSAVRGAFVPAGALSVGETVVARAVSGEGVSLALVAVAREPGPVEVWDVTVVPGHTLLAAGVWAHNY